MTFDVFQPAKDPASPSKRTVTPRVDEAVFGDGYSQRSGDGLNALPQTFQAQWNSLTRADADDIEAFFGRHVSTPFLWTVPGQTVQRKWTAQEWSVGDDRAGVVSFSATLKERFDL